MQKMEELRDMLCEELDKITKKGELSAGSLDVIDKLTHSIKSIDTIIAMEDAGYSSDGYSYARGRRGSVRRDSMGRYSRDYMYDGGSNDDGYSSARSMRGGYSRADAMDELKDHLHQMKNMVKDEESKRMVDKWIRQTDEM